MQLRNPILGTGIRLRQMTVDDIADKVRWYNDPQIKQSLVLDESFELEKSKQWFAGVKDLPTRVDLVIESLDGRSIGLIGLVNVDARNRTAEIVLVIGETDYWGKGVMLEAESLLIGWAFSELKLEKIWAQTRPENIASLITMKKLGFQIEGTLRKEKVIAGQRVDIVHLGLLPSEFKPHC
jgi:RimJ/RimL family protein N-acetyltransferase